MSVSQVMGETRAEITRQSDIIELIAPIKRIHTLSSAHIPLDNILILLQRLPGNVFQMLAHQGCPFSHVTILLYYVGTLLGLTLVRLSFSYNFMKIPRDIPDADTLLLMPGTKSSHSKFDFSPYSILSRLETLWRSQSN